MNQSVLSPSARQQGDASLWLTAFGLSALLHLALLPLIGWCLLSNWQQQTQVSVKAAEPERVMTLQIERPAAAESQPVVLPQAPKPQEAPKQFARTSPDQTAPPERKTPFIGERNTRATSDRPPDPNAPALPSQRGIDRPDREMETTESRYQDGELAPSPPTTIPSTQVAPPAEPLAAVAPTEAATQDPTPAVPRMVEGGARPAAPRQPLAESPLQVDRLVPLENAPALPPAPQQPPAEPRKPVVQTPPTPQAAPAATPQVPAAKPFQGNQRKTAIVGSISRTGRSALDVEDSPLGRYQAAISRAVELEWQRNCVRHRDFITPGFLTVRFFVENSGRIRSVQFVGDMETGEVQKGFTLNSIRDAAIPAMPADLRDQYAEEPLELIFRFFF